jgi:hypothetical protein
MDASPTGISTTWRNRKRKACVGNYVTACPRNLATSSQLSCSTWDHGIMSICPFSLSINCQKSNKHILGTVFAPTSGRWVPPTVPYETVLLDLFGGFLELTRSVHLHCPIIQSPKQAAIQRSKTTLTAAPFPLKSITISLSL